MQIGTICRTYNVGGTTFKKSKAIISFSKTITSLLKLANIAFEILNKGYSLDYTKFLHSFKSKCKFLNKILIGVFRPNLGLTYIVHSNGGSLLTLAALF